MNARASAGAAMVPGVAEPVVADVTETRTAGAEGDWLCAWCLNAVANERDRFFYNGQSEFSFRNPDGVRFEIMTFSSTLGCEENGIPTLKYTWFPGHAWSFCQCGRCGRHIGWFYHGAHRFAGLIKDRLVRGVLIRN